MRPDGLKKSKREVPVPFVSLSDFLRCAHLYEAFHQNHRLTIYV